MKKHHQRTRTCFLEKYGVISIYDYYFDRRYSIDDEDIHFVKVGGYSLIGNPDNPYGTSADHEYFFINDDFLIEF